jgi:hypothetical protein
MTDSALCRDAAGRSPRIRSGHRIPIVVKWGREFKGVLDCRFRISDWGWGVRDREAGGPRQGGRLQAGRVFNSKTEGHGREPTSRGRAAARPYHPVAVPRRLRPPLYVFAKRTHRFGGRNSLDHAHCKILMSFAEGFCRWVRFGKRTHRRGVLRGERRNMMQIEGRNGAARYLSRSSGPEAGTDLMSISSAGWRTASRRVAQPVLRSAPQTRLGHNGGFRAPPEDAAVTPTAIRTAFCRSNRSQVWFLASTHQNLAQLRHHDHLILTWQEKDCRWHPEMGNCRHALHAGLVGNNHSRRYINVGCQHSGQ